MENVISRAELARQLGVSRTYITLLIRGKRTPSQLIANKLKQLTLTTYIPEHESLTCMVGKAGLEPARPKAHDPKSCPSASSGTSPQAVIITDAGSILRIDSASHITWLEKILTGVLTY